MPPKIDGERVDAVILAPVSRGPKVIGVLGAGTMGAGIAQLAAQAGARCLLHDPDAAALERGLESARGRIERGIEKGRLRREDARHARGRGRRSRRSRRPGW